MCLKPRKTHFVVLGSSLFLLWLRVEAKHRHPKIFKFTCIMDRGNNDMYTCIINT